MADNLDHFVMELNVREEEDLRAVMDERVPPPGIRFCSTEKPPGCYWTQTRPAAGHGFVVAMKRDTFLEPRDLTSSTRRAGVSSSTLGAGLMGEGRDEATAPGALNARLAELYRSVYRDFCLKLRGAAPCTVCAVKVQIDIPEPGVVEVLMTGMVVGSLHGWMLDTTMEEYEAMLRHPSLATPQLQHEYEAFMRRSQHKAQQRANAGGPGTRSVDGSHERERTGLEADEDSAMPSGSAMSSDSDSELEGNGGSRFITAHGMALTSLGQLTKLTPEAASKAKQYIRRCHRYSCMPDPTACLLPPSLAGPIATLARQKLAEARVSGLLKQLERCRLLGDADKRAGSRTDATVDGVDEARTYTTPAPVSTSTAPLSPTTSLASAPSSMPYSVPSTHRATTSTQAVGAPGTVAPAAVATATTAGVSSENESSDNDSETTALHPHQGLATGLRRSTSHPVTTRTGTGDDTSPARPPSAATTGRNVSSPFDGAQGEGKYAAAQPSYQSHAISTQRSKMHRRASSSTAMGGAAPSYLQVATGVARPAPHPGLPGNVQLTPLSYIPGGRIRQYCGRINLHFIRVRVLRVWHGLLNLTSA